MNTLRQIFSARTLAALRQNSLFNNLPLDGNATPANHLSTAATANLNNSFLPKELLNTSLLKSTTQLGLGNESFLKNIQQLDRKLEIAYLCKICNTRNLKTVSEAAYNKGVVILQCDGCSTTHLIVDNLGWFANCKGKSVNQVIAEKSEFVRKIVVNEKGELLKN
ncbi:DNL-type zinc finger protein-like [Episyrphus balteatus]|uniref:DNL-type zinc finger protein-like n=1 Tax=Episyrphus balteatus TaxID=286459 RepID=UPI0024865F8A|nr:DNL-type zinc finger protein-like [Episyrphus balteatus]